MVQVLKEEIAQKIFESARNEFYLNGYKGATVRDIAKGAGIPVGLVYSYYENKKTLFYEIVEPVYWMFENLLSSDEKAGMSNEPGEDESLFNELKQILKIFKENREDFLIMIDKSEGTKYENVKRDIVNLTQVHIKENLLKKMSDQNKDIDDFFYHILANNFMESIYEIGRHYKNEKWAEKMLNLVAEQYFYGVNSF